MDSSVNSSQHSGSLSAFFVRTGGIVAVIERGSTGTLMLMPWMLSSAPSSPEYPEFDRILLAVVPCVSAR